MRITRRTLRRGIPLIPLLAFGASCDGDDDDTATSPGADADAALSDAAATTLGENTMSFHLAFEIEGPDVDETGSIEGTGDFATSRGDVATTADGTPEQRAIFDGTDFWWTSGSDAFTDFLPDDKEWVHGNLLEVGDNAVIRELESLAILYLLDGARDVTADAEGTSTRYEFAVDMAVAANRAPAERRAEVEALIDTGDREPTVRGEAIVGADGHVRELTVHGSDGEEPSVEITWTARFDDFGDPVTPEPPPTDEVVELDDVPELGELVGS